MTKEENGNRGTRVHRPDLDWSQMRETVLMMELAGGQIEAAMKDSSSSVEVLTDSFTTMAGYMRMISEAAAALPDSGQGAEAKTELLVLWTDYFKPQHLDKYPDLHDVFWKAAKLCSACKVEVNLDKAQELVDMVKKIHGMFWATKGRDVTFYTAS